MPKGRASVANAKQEHKKKGFSEYSGPALQGMRTVVERGSTLFPAALECIAQPPEELYVVGNVHALQEGLAVVGARKATPYGISCAQKFAGMAAKRGITIISGGARGCDSAAHRAALEHGAPTVVFLGGGCDQLYPASNYRLFQQVVDAGGAVVSENPWGYPPLPHLFRLRNRLIAGLAKATLIVEAGLPSGTFSTADEALQAGKDVLVVPGSIASPWSKGANRLIAQGAAPVVDEESFNDLLLMEFGVLRQETYAPAAGEGQPATGGEGQPAEDDPLLCACLAGPVHMDDLLQLAATLCEGTAPSAWLAVKLATYEAAGLVARFPDGRYGPRVR